MEDYKEKYEMALEGIQEILDSGEDSIKMSRLKLRLQGIFPELADSEDERIRKTLIRVLNENVGNGIEKYGAKLEDALAWLEKQGEFDANIITREDEILQALSIGLSDVTKKLRWSDFGGLPIEEIQKWLEKQCEHKLVDKIQLGKKYKCIASPRYSTFMIGQMYEPKDKFLCSLMNFCYNCFEPIEDDEQKPTDKIKPKFKVGDWISGYYTNYKVLSINNEGYVVEDVDGYKINILFENEKFHHLWSIADAKDGDVLVSRQNYPFIYNGKHDGESVGAYCGMTVSAEFIESQTICSWTINKGSIKPATKEQRELLFRKMEEERFEWNPITKELSQISVTKKSDKDKKMEFSPDELLEEAYQQQAEDLIDMVAEKSAWSDEDEKNLQGVIDEIQANKSSAPEYDLKTYDKFLSWLKSIKDRVQPQPKQEWTKENEMSWKNAIEAAVSYFGLPSETVNWLKSIKERMQ